MIDAQLSNLSAHFPSFLEGLSLRQHPDVSAGGVVCNFPSFLEGLSLRPLGAREATGLITAFPFLFGRAFIEACEALTQTSLTNRRFPFLFGRDFIEAGGCVGVLVVVQDFPSFLEGLSLRREVILSRSFPPGKISLPFWRGFH